MGTEPDTRRIALVLDIHTAEPVTTLDLTARGWLCELIEHLANRGHRAVPVRIDIDGWPHLFP